VKEAAEEQHEQHKRLIDENEKIRGDLEEAR
jgi:hypothetical protein